MAAQIHLERMLLRDAVAVAGDSAMNYLLVKLIPVGGAGGGSAEAMPLNVALVLDVSGSMYGENRLANVKAAVIHALELLKPTDMVSVVAFGGDARAVLPAAPAKEPQRIRQCVEAIDKLGVDAGGTSMHLGIQQAVEQIHAHQSPGRFHRIVVLTDGQTIGESECRQIVAKEAAAGITFSTVGVGTDWNEDLLKGLADAGKGNWHYIDSADKARQVFREEFKQMASTAFANVRLSFRGSKDVQVRRGRQVVPECKELDLQPAAERQWTLEVGEMQNDAPRAMVLDLLLPRRPPGQFVIGNVACTFDAPADGITGQSTGDYDVRVAYVSDAGQSYINAQVARYIDELQTFDMAGKIQTALAAGDRQKATMLANSMVGAATRLGAAGAQKTQLASRVVAELQERGTLSRETQLALQDGARKTQLAEDSK